MPQSSPRSVGREVQQDAIAVANVGPAHDAEGRYLGTLGTRQADLDQLVRKRPSTAQHLVFVYAAGLGGCWLDRYLTKEGQV
jgi:hypothetical protein